MRDRQAASDAVRAIALIPGGQLAFLVDGFRELVGVEEVAEPRLAGVLRDAVAQPGSFLRAQVAYDVGRRHGAGRDEARALAVAVEYFHTASLIFDDLPMMDDARERRGRPCPHRVYGEPAAVLGALALIDRAYALVWEVLAEVPSARARRAGVLVTSCLGARGVLGGQSRDLHPHAGTWSEEEILAVALGKTVPLIRLTLMLPALATGAGEATLAGFDRLSRAWGLVYQILDDCKDALMGPAETGKSTARDGLLGRPNLLRRVGPRRVERHLAQLLEASRTELDGLATSGATSLDRLQGLLEGECAKVRSRLDGLAILRSAEAAKIAPPPVEAAAC